MDIDDESPLLPFSSPPSEVIRALEDDLCSHPRASRRVVLVPHSPGGTPESVQDLQDPTPSVTDLPTWGPVFATQVELPVPCVQVPFDIACKFRSRSPGVSKRNHRGFVR